jgi:hypothetical protein
MNRIKYIWLLLVGIAGLSACTKENFGDADFVNSATAPAKLSAMYNITQDNSGQVTITPNGEGLAYSLVYFGDGTASPANVPAGKNVTHRFKEGIYTVKLRGITVNGLTTEVTQPLTVSFRQPENLQVTAAIDAANKFKVNVTATADYETFFEVYFGEDPNAKPLSFLEGETASYTYSKTGTFNIRVVALSGGAATAEKMIPVTIVNPVLLPVDFEDPNQPYPFVNFDGGVSTVMNNPVKSGINTTNRVARMVKNPGQPWGGSLLSLGEPINFASGKIFRMKVYSPRVGAKVLLKVENATNGSISFEKEVSTTLANTWEDLVFDYSTINTANQYQNLVIIFDLGTPGDGSANFTWYYDDIRLTNTLPSNSVEVPLTFEQTNINFSFTNFDGGNATVIDNPYKTGANTTNRVGKMVKGPGGQPWGGSFINLDNPINFAAGKIFNMKVYSPRAGAKVLLKVENQANPSLNFEKEATLSVANAWQDVSFDYSAINTANVYNRVVIIFELGTPGDGSANFTFHFDEITLSNTVPGSTLNVPLNFESSTLTYAWFDFDGGNATVIDNPFKTGINTSNKVTRMIKNAGQPWGGSFLTLDGPINFASSKTFSVKVYSPRVGAKMLLKVENKDNPNQNFEKEVACTKAGEWETLTFDYSAINTANVYNRIVVIFDLGTVGDGSSNFTWYFDDITL